MKGFDISALLSKDFSSEDARRLEQLYKIFESLKGKHPIGSSQSAYEVLVAIVNNYFQR